MIFDDSAGPMRKDRPSLLNRRVEIGRLQLEGSLTVPAQAKGLVIFAHGSGSSRLSPRNTRVARVLNARGLATLLFDLLTEREAADRANVFDISLLSSRVVDAVRWAGQDPDTAALAVGLFGASTGAAATLVAAAESSRRSGGDRLAWWSSGSGG